MCQRANRPVRKCTQQEFTTASRRVQFTEILPLDRVGVGGLAGWSSQLAIALDWLSMHEGTHGGPGV